MKIDAEGQADIEKSTENEAPHTYLQQNTATEQHDFGNQTEIDEFFTHSRFAALKVIILLAIAIIAFILWAYW